ncbi:hypothetical protein FA95DRAFT_1679820 [Auriscalpium vulgare]|uniref:Uncharacterized protein n=1 Tax=Auriscalpium vulgare TaxID=40419 RepID=A0ACB8RR04_9AGAM|nr:hypothetical protein FA95DRAFT_1679820 [Auriscalpium vulgare]
MSITLRPQMRDASPPFTNSPYADVILRSSDNVNFRVSRHILCIVSPVFVDMFGSPKDTDSITPGGTDGMPVEYVTEDAATLDLLLRWCYPVVHPPLKTLDDARRMVTVTTKYRIHAFGETVYDALHAHIEHDPLGVFEIAIANSLGETAQRAARGALKIPLSEVTSSTSSKRLGSSLVTFMQYYLACGAAASAVTARRNFFIKLPDLVYDATEQIELPHFHQCCVIDPLSVDPSWSAPRALWQFLDATGRALLLHPDQSAFASLKVEEYCNGTCTRRDFDGTLSQNTKLFHEILSREVNAEIDLVPIPEFVTPMPLEEIS